ncbi:MULTISPECIES: hypothetical protein [unclassified Facklamia]|uniref:hypothetical protein n=1 Tax=Aerococcaceae TaxID=186827 RepID=UPI0013B6A3EE|nr:MULTISPECIES: hypothetical protein [unclassified Facklamia]NEW64020.1 hypothetical protein [Facklamia sp. 252]NEW68811.1 hypothetical protein [Facklamia sp. 253]QQD65364.1 hypothetical protein JDW14_08715 [Aerococcaceae bacterium zg-252]
MAFYGIATDRNMQVIVNANYLNYMGRVATFKDYATQEEIEKLESLLKAIKQLPMLHGKIIVLRYFKMARYEKSKDKKIKVIRDVYHGFKGKAGLVDEAAKIIGISQYNLRKLEYESYTLLAEYLLAEKLQGYQLIKPIEKKHYRGTVDALQQVLEIYQKDNTVINVQMTYSYGDFYNLNFDIELAEKWVKR